MTDSADEIASLVQEVNRAWLEGRYEDIARYVHESAVIAPPGAEPVQGRDRFVDSYAEFGGAAQVHSFEPGEPKITIWGPTAVAQYPFVIDYELASGRFKERGEELLVLTKGSSGWQVCWRTLSGQPFEE